jgi:hypothetical protein
MVDASKQTTSFDTKKEAHKLTEDKIINLRMEWRKKMSIRTGMAFKESEGTGLTNRG